MKDNQIGAARESASRPLPFQTNPPDRVLVVDDDLSIRRSIVRALMRFDYGVVAVADGAAAWQALNTDSYDLLITDRNLPKVSGVELLQKLRAASMTVPVIMTAETFPKERFTREPWLEPAASLLKPYTVAELVRTVKKVLREADNAHAISQLLMDPGMKDNDISHTGTPQRRPANSPRRILVVDEDSDLRLLYAGALAGPSYYVDFAADGTAAWNALHANRYDLLITEHATPTLTGVELVRSLRAARIALPVVMAAGKMPANELVRDPSLQLAATLLKPFAVDALLDTVKSVLRATDNRREPIPPPPNWRSRPPASGLRL